MKRCFIMLFLSMVAVLIAACSSTKSYDDGYNAGYQAALNALNNTANSPSTFRMDDTTEDVSFDEWYKEWRAENPPFSEMHEKYVNAQNGFVLQPEPKSGTILSGREHSNGSTITVTASGSSACVVKLKNTVGTTMLSFYVRADDTVTIGVPAEYLYFYFASGDDWYGEDHLFGEDTYYAKDDKVLDFTSYSWEYTLHPTYDGNFTETPIDADEFF